MELSNVLLTIIIVCSVVAGLILCGCCCFCCFSSPVLWDMYNSYTEAKRIESGEASEIRYKPKNTVLAEMLEDTLKRKTDEEPPGKGGGKNKNPAANDSNRSSLQSTESGGGTVHGGFGDLSAAVERGDGDGGDGIEDPGSDEDRLVVPVRGGQRARSPSPPMYPQGGRGEDRNKDRGLGRGRDNRGGEVAGAGVGLEGEGHRANGKAGGRRDRERSRSVPQTEHYGRRMREEPTGGPRRASRYPSAHTVRFGGEDYDEEEEWVDEGRLQSAAEAATMRAERLDRQRREWEQARRAAARRERERVRMGVYGASIPEETEEELEAMETGSLESDDFRAAAARHSSHGRA
uniref:Uncharacterized protein n=1 Tax=Chromera velia CCMP2878 TaxID=1169474 RepID=A0A0G4GKA3_9ALVE|eukprot:Cvel_22265.t1-p1 / transcript=Cvel_22265.t1 / gene=Cvel_22265 / organism=Chromera_velia_CCMP2878 / gene_product=hypothetical protein / transcript_product=hypothetical protein / location=Cvel_scaffold2171:28403-30841(+) / protein_length=347 / sequence_SO=supercontig / SO=protein_coding / is_pseudo=false